MILIPNLQLTKHGKGAEVKYSSYIFHLWFINRQVIVIVDGKNDLSIDLIYNWQNCIAFSIKQTVVYHFHFALNTVSKQFRAETLSSEGHLLTGSSMFFQLYLKGT